MYNRISPSQPAILSFFLPSNINGPNEARRTNTHGYNLIRRKSAVEKSVSAPAPFLFIITIKTILSFLLIVGGPWWNGLYSPLLYSHCIILVCVSICGYWSLIGQTSPYFSSSIHSNLPALTCTFLFGTDLDLAIVLKWLDASLNIVRSSSQSFKKQGKMFIVCCCCCFFVLLLL